MLKIEAAQSDRVRLEAMAPSTQQARQPRAVLDPERLAKILESHQLWLDTRGSDGARATLHGVDLVNADLNGAILQAADLQNADLRNANLADADLRNANLRGSDLREANLRGADLRHANARNADFRGAVFQGPQAANPPVSPAVPLGPGNDPSQSVVRAQVAHADFRRAELGAANWSSFDLAGTKLQESCLSNANLEKVTSLVADRLAGADVTNAQLPEYLKDFARPLEIVKDACSAAQKVHVAIMVGCAYSFLTLFTTTDITLVTHSSTSQLPLPIIGAAVPIGYYYWAAPLVLLAVYIYFHVALQRIWEHLARLPARLPAGRSLDRAADPWLMIGLVRSHVRHLRLAPAAEGGPIGERFFRMQGPLVQTQNAVSISLAWLLIPATISALGWRYLPAHDPAATAVHVLVLSAALTFGYYAYVTARRTLRSADTYARTPTVLAWCVPRAIGIAALIGGLAYQAAFSGSPWMVASLDEQNLSEKPANYASLAPDVQLASIQPANLRRGDLRGARARRAFFVRADVRDGDLRGADLAESNLSAANFSDGDGNGDGANLGGANLRGVDLAGADLAGAHLSGTDLTSARLVGANFIGAHLVGTNLAGTNLAGTHLTGADLAGADLTSADLTGAILNRANLDGAHLSGTVLLAADLTDAVLRNAHLLNANLSGANLIGAESSGADLSTANLTGANLAVGHFAGAKLADAELIDANLAGADLKDAILTDANLASADLADADLTGAHLDGADLATARNLIQEQLDAACGDARTQVPPSTRMPPPCR